MAISSSDNPAMELPLKLWVYTNYHCNLACSYCVAMSTPQTPKRTLNIDFVKKLVDESISLGFERIYFTGGEPFLLDEIYEMLAYASQRVNTTVLTNAMLIKGERLERLDQIRNDRLIIQVSLDGSCPEFHDPYRGNGSWVKTVRGLQNLIERRYRVTISTTETPANTADLDRICAYHLSLGIPEEDHVVRPLARRGFSIEGVEVCKANLVPELTVNDQGVYWHPLSTDQDFLISENIFPLVDSVEKVRAELKTFLQTSQTEMNTFK